MTTTIGATRKSLRYIKNEVQYYQHQVDGIREGARRTSFLLADDPGLGKSLEALTVVAIDFERDLAKRCLVVCPATLKGNWLEEIEQHTNFHALVVEGDRTDRDKCFQLFTLLDLQILIVNYEQVYTHLEQLNDLKFDIIIYDEAHYFKNPEAKRTKAVLKLRAKRHIPVTGTPLLNQVNELWAILHRIDPQQFPHYFPFRNRYCAMGGFKGKQIIGVKNKAELESKLKSVMIRRLKKDVLDLPEKHHVPVYVDLYPEQRELYDSAANDLKIELPDSPTPQELENALVKNLKLKQICGTTACIPGYDDISVKLDRAVQLLLEFTYNNELESPSEPVVVFTQFRDVSRCLHKRLQEIGLASFELNGDVKMNDRVALVERWANYYDSSNSNPRAVLIVMLQLAVGLNMTAANRCIFLDKLYVPKLNEQAEDRLHRIGTDLTKPIQIFEIIARKTVEQRIETILRGKRKLFNTMIEDNAWKAALYKALKEDD